MRLRRALALAALVLAASTASLTAQIGRVVGVAPSGSGPVDVLVLRPEAQRGEAALLVFRRDEAGEWVRLESLRPAAPSAPYEGFGLSLAVAPGLVAVAAADAEAAWAGSLYRRGEEGWRAVARIPATPDASTPDVGGGGMTMSRLMRIMQPQARALALEPSGSTMAVWIQGSQADRIRVLSSASPAGEWGLEAELMPPDSAGFGGAVMLAAGPDRLAVGAPGRGPAGAVLMYTRTSTGDWVLQEELVIPPLGPGAGVGAAVVLGDGLLLVGAPGAGAVLTFRETPDGWTSEAPLRAPDAAADPGYFGLALASDGRELWVGAPTAAGQRGEVHRYRRLEDEGGWDHIGLLATGAAERDGFGAALALGGSVGVVGAPGADGGQGRVAAFIRHGEDWGVPAWLSGQPAPETVAGGIVPCQEGAAAGFDCRRVDLLAFLSLETLGAERGERVSDVWGWTDPVTAREYALVGRTAGMAIVDVTDPTAPAYVGLVPANPSGARDIKTYADHAFFTGDGAGDHGLVIFDLTRVREPRDAPASFEADATYRGITSAHNLIMDAESGIAVPVGASGRGETCGGGFHMIDVSAPLEPVFLGCYTDDIGLIAPGRSHDGQCVVYRGPDARYRDRNVCFASNETALRILDITDAAAVEEVAHASYPGAAYTHQGWLTEDHRYFFMNDELDELVGLTDRTRTLIWDVAELDDPVLVAEHLGPDRATDHNLYIRGDRMYQANYQAGMRVIDIGNPLEPVEIGFFDTTPYDGNPPGFGGGAWTAYPFLESGTVVVSSMNEGLFLLRPQPIVP